MCLLQFYSTVVFRYPDRKIDILLIVTKSSSDHKNIDICMVRQILAFSKAAGVEKINKILCISHLLRFVRFPQPIGSCSLAILILLYSLDVFSLTFVTLPPPLCTEIFDVNALSGKLQQLASSNLQDIVSGR